MEIILMLCQGLWINFLELHQHEFKTCYILNNIFGGNDVLWKAIVKR